MEGTILLAMFCAVCGGVAAIAWGSAAAVLGFDGPTWTEIKLEVTRPPENLSDGEIHEAHLTGAKAYHFCRAHLRVKSGRVEFVKAHWRGDPSLGIKRSRYTVTP